MRTPPRLAVLIVAAGKGVRAGAGLPKQYRLLSGVPLIGRTIDALRAHLPTAALVPVIAEGDDALFSIAIGDRTARAPVTGGATRQDSVRLGLEILADDPPDIVLIHDAARPFVSRRVVDLLVDTVAGGVDGAAPGVAIADSIKRCDSDGAVEASVLRDRLWRVQTPQVFQFQAILEAHRAAAHDPSLSDDLGVAERAGLRLKIVEGDEANFKITTAADFARAESMLVAALPDVRTSQGFDVHAFGPGEHVTLCGVRISHTQGLVGHSDADVGLHALTDAILGSIAAGDIGAHFPPSDPRWKGADSAAFLEFAGGLVTKRGGMIAHVDVTLICEAPRIGPHRAAMTERIASLLGISPDRVSVKATTTEQLGFTGRREGIAAMAIATVRLP